MNKCALINKICIDLSKVIRGEKKPAPTFIHFKSA